jgi:hypothetical protein
MTPLSATSNLADPTALGTHGTGTEVWQGLIYTGKAGFFDLGHARDNCDLTKYVHDQIVAVKGAPVIIKTMHGTATVHTPIPSSGWIQVARAISYDDSVGYEIITYDDIKAPAISEFIPGTHNSSFSPEDLCSNYLGTLLAERAILAGGAFTTAVTSELNTMLRDLNAQPVSESLKAFNLVKNCWVRSINAFSWKDDAYLQRRNFTPIPWKTGHSSDSSPPAWVALNFGNAATFYTYEHTLKRTIPKGDFSLELKRIQTDAAKRYGRCFDNKMCPCPP